MKIDKYLAHAITLCIENDFKTASALAKEIHTSESSVSKWKNLKDNIRNENWQQLFPVIKKYLPKDRVCNNSTGDYYLQESDSVREHRELQRETKFNMLSTEAIRMLREKIPEDLDPDSEEWEKTNEDFMQKRNKLRGLVFNKKDTGEEFSYGLIHEIAEKYGLDEAALSQSVNKESVKAVHWVMSERARVSREETQRIRDEVNDSTIPQPAIHPANSPTVPEKLKCAITGNNKCPFNDDDYLLKAIIQKSTELDDASKIRVLASIQETQDEKSKKDSDGDLPESFSGTGLPEKKVG